MKGVTLAVALAVAGCGGASPKPEATTAREPKKPRKPPPEEGEVIRGHAVWYGGKHHGGKTASGERFDKHAMTAAHRSLPFGTKVRVTNVRNGQSVVVRINDRGPFGRDKRRIIDLSEAAARKLDFIRSGWAEVTIEVLERPRKKR